ncbi:MAG TPA: trypsin-like peptidase domain-containing protein [Gaiellaceae bacterium]|nr:trypsin-like peptidase domain-containing protein [Gaiellaceae bacterium]
MARRHVRWLVPLAAALVAGAVVAAVSFGGSERSRASQVKPPPGALALQQAIVAVVHTLSPSVVQIQSAQGLGSGIVFDAKGDIVTNNHVVAGGGPYTVTTSAGKRYPAKLVGSFPPDDLAVVKVDGAGLRPATFANSSKLEVGDLAIAIGNPLGLRSSVTDGIVSAFRQGISEGNGVALPTMIQTSAAINPGNSGGALADLEGRVIGIPTLAATDPQLGGGTAPGIGFAIPSNLVRDIASQIVQHGHVVDSHRAYLGIQAGDTGQGVYVGSVEAGGPAASAGLKAGDVITSIAGHPTPTLDELTSVLAQLKPGRIVAVKIVLQTGSTTTLRVRLGTYPTGG